MVNIFKKLAGLRGGNGQTDGEAETEEMEQEIVNQPEPTEWLGGDYDEGQLSIDVYQLPDKLVVKSTIAGVKPEDIDISLNNDMLTIRGKREAKETISEDNYLIKECYWGGFSRSVILPVEIDAEKIEASLDNGILTVTLPKAKVAKQISVKVKEK